MYGPHYEPAPIEKIRKPQWSAENTKKTQGIVDDLYALRQMLHAFNSTGNESEAVRMVRRAIQRLKTLDPNVITKGID